MKKYNLLAVTLFLSILSFNCSKEGPAGPAGPAGPQGIAGPTGPQGQIGNANVIYSPWFLTGTGWTATGAVDYGAQFLFNRSAPGITQTIMDQGVVLGYIKGEPNTPTVSTQVFQLPYGVGIGFGFVDFYELVLNAPGNIRFLYKSDTPWTAAELAPISFRYIIIPGGIAGGRIANGSAQSYSQAQLKAMSYEEVIKLFNIPADGQNEY